MAYCEVSLPNRILRLALSFALVLTVGWTSTGSAFAEEKPSEAASAQSQSEISVDTTTPLIVPGGVVGAVVDAFAHDAADDEAAAADVEAQEAAEERATDAGELGYIPDEVVVVYEDAASSAEIDAALETIEGEEVGAQIDIDSGAVARVDISDDLTVESAAEIIEADPAVKYAFPNYIAESYDSPTAELMTALDSSITSSTVESYSRQWHLDYVKAPDAWNALANSGKTFASKVKVAVIDTGASLDHPDLKNVIDSKKSIEVIYDSKGDAGTAARSHRALQGDGRTNGGTAFQDQSSHGTHVSGIIAAEANNGGVLGVASGGNTAVANKLVEIVAIDAFSLYVQSGSSAAASATLLDIVYALKYAAMQGCRVANLSLGFPATDESLNAYFEELTTDLTQQNDMILIAAAGNSGNSTPSVPAMCANVIAVVNVNSSSKLASTSSYGAWCDIAAPGENILSTLFYKGSTNAWGTMSGTSMASPTVAAIAAMMCQANPKLTAQQVNTMLCSTATALSGVTGAGSGLVNAKAAVDAALASAQTTPTTPTTPTYTALTSSNVKLSQSTFTYSGYAQKPTVAVSYGSKTLKSGTDYTVTYGTASSAVRGTYYVTVTGKGSYTGSITKYYYIVAASLSAATISSIASQQYTGRAITPAITVKAGGRVLTKGTDYTVAYSNNVNVGTATVKITGKGNYTGTRSTTFAIKGRNPSVAYSCHVQNIGWQSEVKDGALGGTSGRSLRVEAFKVRLVNAPYSGDIRVRAHVQNIGWQNWVTGSSMILGRSFAGTSGRSLRVEALKIELTGTMASYYDVYYRTHVQNIGWTGWAKNGAQCGSSGYGYRMEAVQIRLVAKGGSAPGSTSNTFAHPLVSYQTHVQNIGWQSPVFDGATGGTSGRSLRVEAFKVSLVEQPYSGSIQVSSHVQNIGWQAWSSNGALSGTSGRSLRVEALKVRLTGTMAQYYDVYYRTHCQNVGWTGWAKNGVACGTAGFSYRMEAVQIKLVPKGSAAPGSTARSFYQR